MAGSDNEIERILQHFDQKKHMFQIFLDGVESFFLKHPNLTVGNPPAVHSVRSRVKDRLHLREKLRRQERAGKLVTAENVFSEITDLVGVRVLHLHQRQLEDIDRAIKEHVEQGEWVFDEPPKAYSWDPDATEFFHSLGLQVDIKESHYTSVHYLVRPRADAIVCCEIQVRTLLEEVWGEIDHAVNYPKKTGSTAVYEQLRVMAKLVATGSRLADSIIHLQNLHDDEASGSE